MKLSSQFTPIMDDIAGEIGLIPAAVYGIVWRYCQLDDGVCRASLQTMGEKLGANKATVMRHIKQLCELGYIIDLDKGRRNSAHRYRINDKKLLQSATVDEHNLLHSATVESEKSQTVAECNATVAECNATVAESNLKRQETLKETNNNSAGLKALITNYQDFISLSMSQTMADELSDYASRVHPDWVANAFKVAEAQNVRKWSYVRAILDSCIAAGRWVDKRNGKTTSGAGGASRRVAIG